MSRRRKTIKRVEAVDPKYGSAMVSHMVNYMMKSGKKTVAQRIVYGAIDEVAKKLPEEDALEVVNKAIENMKPKVEVKSKRIGGASYQVPMPINERRQLALALRWLVQYASGRHGLGMPRAVAAELLDAFKGEGNIIKKRDDTHKMAQANKAFAHYAF